MLVTHFWLQNIRWWKSHRLPYNIIVKNKNSIPLTSNHRALSTQLSHHEQYQCNRHTILYFYIHTSSCNNKSISATRLMHASDGARGVRARVWQNSLSRPRLSNLHFLYFVTDAAACCEWRIFVFWHAEKASPGALRRCGAQRGALMRCPGPTPPSPSNPPPHPFDASAHSVRCCAARCLTFINLLITRSAADTRGNCRFIIYNDATEIFATSSPGGESEGLTARIA
jgi:hypothetical protein